MRRLIVFFSEMINKGLPLISSYVFLMNLGLEAVGDFNQFIVVYALVLSIILCGLDANVTRLYRRYGPRTSLLSYAYIMVLYAFIVGLFFIWLIVRQIFFESNPNKMIVYGIAYGIIISIYMLQLSIYHAQNRFVLFGLYNSIPQVVVLLFTLVTEKYDLLSVEVRIVFQLFVLSLVSIWLMIICKKPKNVKFRPRFAGLLFKYYLSMLSQSLINYSRNYSINIVLISGFSQAILGSYALAWQLASVFTVIVNMASKAFITAQFEALRNKRQVRVWSFVGVNTVCAFIFFGMFLVFPFSVMEYSIPNYNIMIHELFGLLGIGAIMSVSIVYLSNIMHFRGEQKKLVSYNFYSFLVQIIWVFINRSDVHTLVMGYFFGQVVFVLLLSRGVTSK